MKKILCSVLSVLCIGTLGMGMSAMNAAADGSNELSNKDFFSAKGATLAASETANGLKLSLSGVSTKGTNQDVASIYYNNLINVSELATGITLLNESATAAREFDFMSIILRDSEDPTQVMTTHLQYANWYGSTVESASLGLWDEFSYSTSGAQKYVYDGEVTAGGAAVREWLVVANGTYNVPGDGVGLCRLGNPAKVLWGSNNEVVPFTFTYSNSVVKIGSRIIAELNNEAYFVQAIKNVSEADHPELYDNLNSTYAANLFSSGKVTMELQFGNVKDGEFDVCLQKIGAINLIGQADTIEDNKSPTLTSSSYYDPSSGKYAFEQGKNYNLDELKNKIVSVSDNIDPNPTVTLELYNAQDVKYEGNTVSFTEGDYFKIIATDQNGNVTTLTTKPFELYSLGILSKYSVEISDQAVRYGVLADLPSGYGYTAALYESDDTQYQNPLTEESSYLFTDVGNYKIKFTVYDNDLVENYYYADLEVTDKVAPSMTFEEEYDENGYSMNERVKIIMPTLADNNANGEPTVTVKAYFGETETPITDGHLTLLEVGSYVVEYTAVDKSGNVSVEKKIVVNTGEDRLSPEMSFAESYEKTYKANEKIKLIMPTVSDNVDASPTVTVEVALNGELISVKDNAIKPNQEGTLTIAYFVEDAAGNQTMEIVTIQIVGKSETGGCKGCNGSLTGGASLIGCVLVGAAIGLKRKKKGGTDDENEN